MNNVLKGYFPRSKLLLLQISDYWIRGPPPLPKVLVRPPSNLFFEFCFGRNKWLLLRRHPWLLSLFIAQLKQHQLICNCSEMPYSLSQSREWKKTTLVTLKGLFTRWLSTETLPVRSGHPLWGQTTICQMVFVFHHPLNLHGMSSPCERCCGQYEKMRDCWPSSAEAQLKNYSIPPTAVTPALPHRANQPDTQSVRLYKQMFPGGNFQPLALGSNRGLRGLCAQVHMCSCGHCYAVFLCSRCVFGPNKALGMVEFVFFSVSGSLFLCSISSS